MAFPFRTKYISYNENYSQEDNYVRQNDPTRCGEEDRAI